MMRRAILLLMMAAGLALVVWSGWKNLRQRRSAMQAQQQGRVDLMPGMSSAAAGDSSAGQSQLRGKPAPAFTLLDLNGNKVSLSDFKGRPLVVNFWGTYCAPCKIEMPWLEEFSKKYAPTASRSSASHTTPRSAATPSPTTRNSSASPTPSCSPPPRRRKTTSAAPTPCPCPSTSTKQEK